MLNLAPFLSCRDVSNDSDHSLLSKNVKFIKIGLSEYVERKSFCVF